ncbi:hypothetical protein FQN54_008222 [Arachnomyces sp. PD_36]|nr:hypothetical protein FQN54_008222 [Arachnomyces sp. PD_36]
MDKTLVYILNHVFLPPKLPQEDDENLEGSKALLEELLTALVEFRRFSAAQELTLWSACAKMVRNIDELRNGSGGLSTERLGEALNRMTCGGMFSSGDLSTVSNSCADILPILIRGQNAGIIARRSDAKYYFESFELSPKNANVIGAKGRLRRCFPGPTVAVDQARVADDSFRRNLIECLVKLDDETPEEVSAVSKKAGSKVREHRDTINPRFVTEMVTGILRAVGEPIDVRRIHKRTREDVLWDNSKNPWRRSPLWLLLRVALQTSLFDPDDPSAAHARYKSFMIFFMTRLLERAWECSLPDDLLFIMSSKISRRVQKLGLDGDSGCSKYTMEIVSAVHNAMATRWESMEADPDPQNTQLGLDLTRLHFPRDTQLSLDTLRPYLTTIDSRKRLPSNLSTFAPRCRTRILQSDSQSPDLNLSYITIDDEKYTFLSDLELWVQDCLSGWLRSNIDDSKTCTSLKSLIDTYTKTAIAAYQGRPADISLMLLTLMDIWVALDKCAIRHCALLGDYSPEFPVDLFEPLLLPTKTQMQRLLTIEQYLTGRRNDAVPSCPSIFRSIKERNSFAVRYFDQSPEHDALRLMIETKAQNVKERKLQELQEKREKYDRLKQESDSLGCEYTTRWKRRRQITTHSNQCKKCRLSSQAKSLCINVHEWPLPKDDLEAKAAIFELDVPAVISKWRDATYGLLVDVFSSSINFRTASSGVKEKAYTVQGYDGLKEFVKSPVGRLQIASGVKPFTASHYSNKLVSEATARNVCVGHGMRYELYDSKTANWAVKHLDCCDVRKKCTYSLLSTKYNGLQYAVDNTTHTSNEVISRQNKCPPTLTLHEFYAFGTLRSGHRLQWRNIARELIAQVLDFSHEETHTLITQSIWQAGPHGKGLLCRDSHSDLEEPEFGKSFALHLDDALAEVEKNWQGVVAVRTYVALAVRLLSLANDSTVRLHCCRILRRARGIVLCWCRELGKKLQEAQNEEAEVKYLNERTLEMALTCYGTFDVEPHHLPDIIDSEDIAAIIECSITIHDHCPPSTNNLLRSTKLLLQRYLRLAHLLEPFIREHVDLPFGLNSTISRVWAGYKEGRSWAVLPAPHDRWVRTQTSSEGGRLSMAVHYNILDGTLLVNGLPLTRLPSSYEGHPTYRRLLSEKVLDVVPSTMDNMVFETRNELFGYQVHFGMHGSELIIRTRSGKQVHELVPIHALGSDFPAFFVGDYAHWLDTNTGFVEWRPLTDAWKYSPDNWRMKREGDTYILTRGNITLIDVQSETTKAISQILMPLERAEYIHVSLNHEKGCLDINLPRLNLDFCLHSGGSTLESKQFREMAVDSDQSFGAFTGLVHKLVLRSSQDSSRGVIIPHGDVSSAIGQQHVSVTIRTGLSRQVSHHFYQIDSFLGRLVDNGSLRSRLFKYYLHAVTSHCLRDTLTGRTGTEEAICGLRSASSLSFSKLGREEIDLLKRLAGLTPQLKYYPKHLREMQTISWNNNLPPLSQHPFFNKLVVSILNVAKTVHLFQDNPTNFCTGEVSIDEHLLERLIIRQATFRAHGFGAESHTTDEDCAYTARDQVSTTTREHETCSIARKVDDWSVNLKGSSQLLRDIESWGENITGNRGANNVELGFDIKWLGQPSRVLPRLWRQILDILTQSIEARDKYGVMFFLSSLTYSQKWKQELVQTLLAFATVRKIRTIQAPDHPEYRLNDGYCPNRGLLIGLVENHARPFHDSPEQHLVQLPDESTEEADDRRREEYRSAKELRIERFVDALIRQWPRPKASAPTDSDCQRYIKVGDATRASDPHFLSWFRNYEFKNYIEKVQIALDRLPPAGGEPQKYLFNYPPENYQPRLGHVSFEHLRGYNAPVLTPAVIKNFHEWVGEKCSQSTDHGGIIALLSNLKPSSGGHEQQYADDLAKSFKSLRNDESNEVIKAEEEILRELKEYARWCKDHVEKVYNEIYDHLWGKASTAQQLACEAKAWPPLGPTSLLCYLAKDKLLTLNESWKRALVEYGIAISVEQRADRLVNSAGSPTDLLNELRNPCHEGWDPMQYPDWLLLEIENNILIRPVQAQVAQEMISPSSEANSIMQLNMGEGKSSVIVPIVAAALADGKSMVRVVVLKPLSGQMLHLLVQKLGGMLNRRIFHIPISRSLQLDVTKATLIREIYQECLRMGGILLVQPEHLLSFELMGFDRLLSGDLGLGNAMIETQRWLDRNSRDILDESDEILSVRFELIYTMGAQCAIEFSPERWTIIQHVLKCVSSFAVEVLDAFPDGLEINSICQGSFPRLRVLQPSAGDELLTMVARHVCDKGLPGIPVWNLPTDVRANLFRYLTEPFMTEADAEPLLSTVSNVESMKVGLLLLRGLIAGGVLKFALESKRWRVNYGLDPSRTMLAVPYRAKDSPATRAEFSHPDATIVLTCLAYYYGGLTDSQLKDSFEKLFLSDHAQEEYDSWVKDAPELPVAYRQLSGINLLDTEQCPELVFPKLRFAKGAIDFYLSNTVFPKEMKEFPRKLSSSGWDIARAKTHPTTGFSGTNDSRYILPLSVEQSDLPQLQHTNAAQLECLLRPENSFHHLEHDSPHESLDANKLLQVVVQLHPPIRVLLDVGAQVLELKNEEVANEWLKLLPPSEAQAAIFFDDHNELSVLSREGTKESLMISPFAKQMDQCLVYLDEAHTRGTDLRLPLDYRAAVTLGPNLTKDRLVQACMRMRKLGKGQSVMFCGPMEVERKILECCGKSPSQRIEVTDVLRWSIRETCIHTKKSIPLWATQGTRYQRRNIAWSESNNDADSTFPLHLAESLLEPEAQSLEQRYGFGSRSLEEDVLAGNAEDEIMLKRKSQLDTIREKCRQFRIGTFNSATLQEEQERELSPENEREQQVERPPSYDPQTHELSSEVRNFIKTGVLTPARIAVQQAFSVLRETTARKSLDLPAWSDRLLVTTDFKRTVKIPANQDIDMFLRPVQWIVSSKRTSYCVILSPFEANELLPSIRTYKVVTLHCYSPRTGASMRSMEDLSLFAIPDVPTGWATRSITMQLNLFAGQLYLRDYGEYLALCKFLGLCSRAPDNEGVQVFGDGFVNPSDRKAFDEVMAKQCRFKQSPVDFLRALMTLRRKGLSFRRSHLGAILNGSLLMEDEFE